jgi:hypothetical protein
MDGSPDAPHNSESQEAIEQDTPAAATETVSALEAPDSAGPQFVRWFREVAP